MARKKRSSANTEQGVPGRRPAPRAKEFAWYGRLKEFETGISKPWWEKIKWEEETQARKAKRSALPRISQTSMVHPGFLWETLRRYPESQKLIRAMESLSTNAFAGKTVQVDEFIGSQQFTVGLMEEVGSNVLTALEVLRMNWQHSFDRIPDEPKNEWMAYYLDLWHQVGEEGSVPPKPPDAQDHQQGVVAGQDKAAFDLLVEGAGHRSDFGGPFVAQPLPHLFLKKFAKLVPKEKYHEEFNSFAAGKTKPDTYPWLSFGILKGRLQTYQMHPMALAVDLSKSNDAIIRDIKSLIDAKRKAYGVVVADRRIREESFKKIHKLDSEVKERIPYAKTVKEFENSARFRVGDLLARVEAIRDKSLTDTSQNVSSILNAMDYVKSNPLSAD